MTASTIRRLLIAAAQFALIPVTRRLMQPWKSSSQRRDHLRSRSPH